MVIFGCLTQEISQKYLTADPFFFFLKKTVQHSVLPVKIRRGYTIIGVHSQLNKVFVVGNDEGGDKGD